MKFIWTDEKWKLYKESTKNKAFMDHLVSTDPDYKRFNFWFRTTKLNFELVELYREWLSKSVV